MKKKKTRLCYYSVNKIPCVNSKIYYKRLYFSKSFIINLYSYTRLYHSLNLVEFDSKKTILDLGCGVGAFFPALNRYRKNTIGLDFSFDILLMAKQLMQHRKHPLKNIQLLNADGNNIPFKDKTIDLIFCLETLEHVPNVNKAINEIFRILKDSGELIYSIPIEIGISLLYRQLIGRVIRFPVDKYRFKELCINGILKKPPERINNPLDHKNFDWRRIQELINKKFKQVSKIYSPFPLLKALNPTIIFKVKKA